MDGLVSLRDLTLMRILICKPQIPALTNLNKKHLFIRYWVIHRISRRGSPGAMFQIKAGTSKLAPPMFPP